MSRITDLTIEGLQKAWINICDLRLKVAQVESNPQLVQIVPPNEVIVLISFELTMGEMRGIMNLCIPYNTIEPLTGKLASNTWSSYTQKRPEPLQALNLETGVSSASVEMVACLAETKLTLGELKNLAVGDVIMTPKGKDDPLEIFIEGSLKFSAFPGVFKRHKAIRISQPIARPADIVQQRLQRRKSEG